MEQQKLPNATLILVFGIASIVLACCSGFIGIVLGIIALVLAKKAKDTYLQNPEIYSDYSNVKTGRVLAIIGVVLNAISIIVTVIFFAFYGMAGFEEIMLEMNQ